MTSHVQAHALCARLSSCGGGGGDKGVVANIFLNYWSETKVSIPKAIINFWPVELRVLAHSGH